jgi:hypothetical protein
VEGLRRPVDSTSELIVLSDGYWNIDIHPFRMSTRPFDTVTRLHISRTGMQHVEHCTVIVGHVRDGAVSINSLGC